VPRATLGADHEEGEAMKIVRTLPTTRLVGLVATVVVVFSALAALAVAASGSGESLPPPKPLDAAIHDALSTPRPDGVTARIRFTNNLLPSGALLDNAASALITGASGRLWVTSDGRAARLELQSDAGDVQVVWDRPTVTVYDASSNTVYKATLPADAGGKNGASPDTVAAPTLAEIDHLLCSLGAHATISAAEPTIVAAQPAYSATLSPRDNGGLLDSLELAWDAAQGVLVRTSVFGRDNSSAALRLEVTDISYGAVPLSDVAVAPPSDAQVVDLGAIGPDSSAGADEASPVTGLDAVRAAAGFPISAPDMLTGLPRREVRLVGGADSKAALVVYGEGLGAIVVVERQADARHAGGDVLASLPAVSLGGLTAHELSTELGTILTWRDGEVDYVVAGSVLQSAAEAAARQLR
jgi:hypothetical protein